MKLATQIINMRNLLKLNNVDVDQHWAVTYDLTVNKLYQAFCNPTYNHFWTLENPEDIENQRIYNKRTGESASIGEISNAFLSACSSTDFATTSDNAFLEEFERFFQTKSQVAAPSYTPF